MNDQLLRQVLARIDAANARDPNQERADGDLRPAALTYALRMSNRLAEYAPDATAALRIAARAQHLERWTSPRDSYPVGRAGYLKWRADLGRYHARRVGEIMIDAACSAADIERVQFLVQKRGLRDDAETQCLEDIICLVFLEHYLAEFATQHDETKVLDILRKTWGKMSPAAHHAAMVLPLDPAVREILGKALS